jgi:hypothetical protein
LGIAFAVNPPRVFSAFWKILTPFMNETTLNKIKFIGGPKGTLTSSFVRSPSAMLNAQPFTDYPLIAEHVDKASLEKTYGGELDRDYDHEAFVSRTPHTARDPPATTPPPPPLCPLPAPFSLTLPIATHPGEIHGEGKSRKEN